jgi:hypothetical protein
MTAVLGVAVSFTSGAAPFTVMVTDCVAVGAVPVCEDDVQPVQVSVYSMVLASAPVDCDPLTAMEPLQPPEAVQNWTFVAFQISVVCPPLAMVVAAAVSVTAGASCRVSTWVVAVLEPLGPVQVTAKVVVCWISGTSMVPLVGCGPVMPLVPTHWFAAELCSIRDVPAPASTTLAAGVSDTEGPAPPPPDWQAARAVSVTSPMARRAIRMGKAGNSSLWRRTNEFITVLSRASCAAGGPAIHNLERFIEAA